MSLTKGQIRQALRAACAAEFADIPLERDIDYTFSPAFCQAMDALIGEEKRGSWRLLSRSRRRALVIAAILAAALLLVACTPPLRQAVIDWVIAVYEDHTVVHYSVQPDAIQRTEIETVYELDPVPEGFTLRLQEQPHSYLVETIYIDDSGNRIYLHQYASFKASVHGEFLGTEGVSPFSKTISGVEVCFTSGEAIEKARFFYDGYLFTVSYLGTTTQAEFEGLVASLMTEN